MSSGTRDSAPWRELIESRLGAEAGRLGRDSRHGGKRARGGWTLLAESVRLALLNGTLTLQLPEVYKVPEEGRVRVMARYGPQETLLLGALHRLLESRLDGALLPQCIGGVKGRSRHSFVGTLARARSARLRWVLVSDVADYYASVEHGTLERVLAGPPFRLARDARALVMGLARLGAPAKGLLPGNALSEHLANYYLHGADEFLARKGLVFCRFIDDFAVFCETRVQAEAALRELGAFLLVTRGLRLSAPKTGVYHRHQQGFEFLGYRVIGDSTLPSPENVARFAAQVRAYARGGQGRATARVVRGLNRRIHWFGHQYKQGRVKLIFETLDEDVRAALRGCLTDRGAAAPASARFRAPARFPCNLAWSNEDLRVLGLASLSKIKADYDRKTGARAGAAAPVARPAAPEILEASRDGEGTLRIVLRAGRSECSTV